MKKIIYTVLFTLITFTFFNCGSTKFIQDKDEWSSQELLPSEIEYNGDIFSIGKLKDGRFYGVFYDKILTADKAFYYAKLMQDLGWYKNTKGNWSSNSFEAIRKKEGYIYTNPKRKVAVYFNPISETYEVFKVKIRE